MVHMAIVIFAGIMQVCPTLAGPFGAEEWGDSIHIRAKA